MTAAFYTLGCKLNQFETESIAYSLKKNGFIVTGNLEKAELFIINTCTVTSKSEQKARRIIRKVLRENPDSAVIVTGCYAQLEEEEIKTLGDNIIVIPQDKKYILHHLRDSTDFKTSIKNLYHQKEAGDSFQYSLDEYTFHSRPFIKIQDGCDYNCAYCRIPLARGKSRSRSMADIIENIKRLESTGYSEVVLTGINISAYKAPENNYSLRELLKEIMSNTASIRVRLSSLEPETISKSFTGILKNKRIRPHFHIPVQSGSDKILKGMRRRYNRQKLIRAVLVLREVKPEAFIAADVIAGFPGETANDFKATFELLKLLQFSRLHVFRYSPRPGTEAFGFIHSVPERIVKERVRQLLMLSDELYLRYKHLWLEKQVEAVLEKKMSVDKWQALSENYLKLSVKHVPWEGIRSGQRLICRIKDINDMCTAEFVSMD